jgi:hypothetical protein
VSERTNTDRAERAFKAIEDYTESQWTPGPREDQDHAHQAIKDVLCDLRHLCDRTGVEFDAADRGAYEMYRAELAADPIGPWPHYLERTA